MELSAGDVFAGYRVIRPLGSGGMGSVLLVQHPRLPRQDAMKVIHAHLSSDPSFAARFEREAELACRLDHPALVRVYDRGCDQGRLWLTLQFVDGPDVDQVLQREGPMAPLRAVRVLEAVAGGLDDAHTTGLVHRDVKPANILLSGGGTGGERAFLTDFGIAHISGASRALTDTGALLASLPYAAPEQLLDRPITAAVDVYALGCVAFELLTGRRLFDQQSSLALMGAVLAGPRPEAWERLPPGRPALRQVLQRAVAPDPGDRPGSCSALAGAVREVLAPVRTTVLPGAAPVLALPPPPAPQPWSLPPPAAPPSWPRVPAAGSLVPQQVPAGLLDAGPSTASRGLPTGPQVPGGPGSRTRRRWPWLAAVVLLLVAAVGGLLVVRPWALDPPRAVDVAVRAEGVEVRWAAVEEAAEYQVHRDGVLVGRSEGTTYLDTDVGSGVRSTYSVAAVAADGERSDLATSATVVSALHPVGDLAAEVLMSGVELTWRPVDNAGHYEVRRDDEVLDARAQGSTFLDPAPPPGSHDYTVVAVDASGDAASSSASVVLEVSPWLVAADLAAAFRDLLPETPGPGGWGDATCAAATPFSSVPATAAISCGLPSGITVQFLQYPDEAALAQRRAQLATVADPAAPFGTAATGGWYLQSPPGNQPAWEAWGFVQPDRRLMEIYVEWYDHTIADLDDAWYYRAPWQ